MNKLSEQVLRAAEDYARRGWSPIPVPQREKGPRVCGWQNLRLTEGELSDYFNGRPQNIGVLLGEPSGGLVDIDLDDSAAVALAAAILPPTGAVFGRAGKPRSHRLYQCAPVPSTAKFKAPDGAMLVELRATGCQTIFPPSQHPSGESIMFDEDCAPASVAAEILYGSTCRLATAALLRRQWPTEGSRQEAALALSGGLLRCGWSLDKVAAFLATVLRGMDDELEKRIEAAEHTSGRLAADQPVTGWPHLVAVLGEAVVRRFREWLGVTGDEPANVAHHTDLGNAQTMVTYHGRDLRFCDQRGGWFSYDGQRWCRDETGEVVRRAKDTVARLFQEALTINDPDRRAKLIKHVLRSESDPRIRAMIALAASEPGIPVTMAQFDADPWLLNCSNGTLNLRTGELGPHCREQLLFAAFLSVGGKKSCAEASGSCPPGSSARRPAVHWTATAWMPCSDASCGQRGSLGISRHIACATASHRCCSRRA